MARKAKTKVRGGRKRAHKLKGHNPNGDKRHALAMRKAGMCNTSGGKWVEAGTQGTPSQGGGVARGLNLW